LLIILVRIRGLILNFMGY